MEAPTSTTTRRLAGIPVGTSSRHTVSIQPTNTDVSGGNGNNGFSGGGSGGTLYLFTFLTTLLLLLAVSCGIVIRSFILRRRFHRRVEEAIAAGVLLPSQAGDIGMGPGGSISVFRRHIGEKPKMWEVWIDKRSFSYKHATLTSEWSKIQPVAATQISDASPKPKSELVQAAPIPLAPTSIFGRITSRLPFPRAQGRGLATTNSTPASPEVPLPALGYGSAPAPGQRPLDGLQLLKDDKTSSTTDSNRSVQVTVLIAMPDPSRPRYPPGSSPVDDSNGENGDVKGKQRSPELPSASTEEHELPEICFGLAHAQITRDMSSMAPHQEQVLNTPKS